MFRKIIATTALGLAATSALAGGEIDFALSNTSVRVEHDAVLVGTGAHISTGAMYNENTDNWAIMAGFNAVDATMANKELIGGVGFKLLLLSSEASELAVAAGVGGFLRWQPEFMNGLGFEGQTYFAPSILSFGGLTSAYEVVARVTYKVLPQARIFVGYHEVTGNYTDISNVSVDSTYHVGFRMTY
ncbi:YfaZ family outer membrane protein [Reinekea sp.]|jgi:hypothetical protein|uniref:YfaZ family outer membrane protein n=1 Tax=Reinekea sp. TaxID=1970455 RepID=UPI002A80FE74|nr:YfaZ family outer membrane protein [Reinekea sp.]